MRYIKQIWQALSRRLKRPATARPDVTPGESGSDRLHAEIAGLQSGLKQLRHRDGQQLEELRQRLELLEFERASARRELDGLKNVLTEAVSRQETAEIHAHNLETRLREQHARHQVDLQEARIREHRQARYLNLAMAVAIAAFVLGGAVSVITFRMAEENTELLAGINQSIRDMQASFERHQAGILDERTTAPASTAKRRIQPRDTPDRAMADSSGVLPPKSAADQLGIQQPLPEPDYVTSSSLPLSGHAFDSRRDVRRFFEENARQPGIVALPSGLQYKVLIPGNGRTPGVSDTVTIEYRAFRPDGSELDNSFREAQPSTFIVSEATPGLREALQQMQEGAQWELYIPPAQVNKGIRKRGRHGFEPLIYTVELLAVRTGHTPDAAKSLQP